MIDETLTKYGWKSENSDDGVKVFNRLNKHVFTITHKGGRYIFTDTGGEKLMTGRGKIEQSLTNIIENFYYSKPLL